MIIELPPKDTNPLPGFAQADVKKYPAGATAQIYYNLNQPRKRPRNPALTMIGDTGSGPYYWHRFSGAQASPVDDITTLINTQIVQAIRSLSATFFVFLF